MKYGLILQLNTHHPHSLFYPSTNPNTFYSRMASSAGKPQTLQFKLVLLGESAVGKSSLVLRFVKDQFDDYRESTIGGE